MSAFLHPREASMLACVTDAVVAPGDGLPVARTDAIAFADSYLARSPALNRAALRTLLYALELAPLALGYRRRLRRLTRAQRAQCLARIERGPLARLLEPVAAVAKFAYYGDDGVARSLGYDAGAVVARGRELRRAEARW